ncbi:MAG: CvpA family protein [Campylobacterota bacterium]|nr:CvpA family protein [Campylobacterota bacterium]
MEFNYFDLIAVSIILLLGLKGIINGFFKELFGLVGIIGGIFIASRVGDEVGAYLSDLIFKFENSSATSFTGFLATLAIFWVLMISVGYAFKKLSHLSGLGIYDKILGFIFGASKFFLIAAVIAHAAYNIKAVKSTVDSAFETSVVFPILVSTGSFIMKLDPIEISDDINATIDEGTETIKSAAKIEITRTTAKAVEDIKEELKESN